MDVVLVGLPGSGKSVVGRRLAARHGAHAQHATESPTNTRAPVSSRTPAISWPKRLG